MGEIIAGILAAVLAAFGFYSLLRTVGELLRPELADLDLFLDEARHGARRREYMPQVLIDRRLLVGMPGELCPDSATLAVLERFGADWYAVDLPAPGGQKI